MLNPNEPADVARVYGIADELRCAWRAEAWLDVRVDKLNQWFYVAYGLAAHVHLLAGTALGLLREGNTYAALPLVRSIYECAVTAQWIQLRPDAANAFLNEDVRNRRSVNVALAEAVSEVMRNGSIPGSEYDKLESSAGGAARTFKERCKDVFAGGSDPYLHYRLMSWYVHPSVAVVDSYLESGDDGDGDLPAIRTDPKEFNPAPYAFMVVSSMVWAARAVDVFDVNNARRSALRRTARELGISDVMELSPAAHQAVYVHQRDVRRSRRRRRND